MRPPKTLLSPTDGLHPRDDFSVLILMLHPTPDTSQQLHLCVHDSWIPTSEPLFLHLDRRTVERTFSAQVDCLPGPPYGVFTYHQPIALFHAPPDADNEPSSNTIDADDNHGENLDALARLGTIQTQPKSTRRNHFTLCLLLCGFVVGLVVGLVASFAIAAVVVPAIQPVLPIHLPIILLMQRLDPRSLALTPPTAEHSSLEEQLVGRASHDIWLTCTRPETVRQFPTLCEGLQVKLRQVQEAVSDVPLAIDKCTQHVAHQVESLVAALRQLQFGMSPTSLLHNPIRRRLKLAKEVPQSYLHHLVAQPDDSQHSAVDRTNKDKVKGKGKPLKRLRNPLAKQVEEELYRKPDSPCGILPAISIAHGHLARVQRLLLAVLADVDLLQVANDDHGDRHGGHGLKTSDQLQQVLATIDGRRVRLELALKGTEALVRTLEDMTGNRTKTDVSGGVGSDSFWAAVWHWAGVVHQEASSSPTQSISLSTTNTTAGPRNSGGGGGNAWPSPAIPRLFISVTRWIWGHASLPPLQPQALAISTAVINLNLGLQQARKQHWAHAQSMRASRADTGRTQLAAIFSELDQSSCWLWWKSPPSPSPLDELTGASPPREWARRFACTWHRLPAELQARVRDKVPTTGRLWVVLVQVERFGPDLAELQ